MKKPRIRLFLEVGLVIVLGYVLYTKWIAPPPEPPAKPAVAETQSTPEEPARMSGFIKSRTKESTPSIAPEKTIPTFNPEPTSASRASDATPTIEATAPLTILSGEVIDSQGDLILEPALVYSRDCNFTVPVQDGRFSIELDPGTCVVYARRQEGEYVLESDPFEIQIIPNQVTDIRLMLGDLEYGSIGIEALLHAEVAEVTLVQNNSPAAAIGMLPGHFIMEVNGMAVAGMSAEAFNAQLLGPVGTPVQLVIVAETEDGSIQEIPVSLERAK